MLIATIGRFVAALLDGLGNAEKASMTVPAVRTAVCIQVDETPIRR